MIHIGAATAQIVRGECQAGDHVIGVGDGIEQFVDADQCDLLLYVFEVALFPSP